ncbi:hypothetical protein BGZ96_002365 [Linnemannia gamsii]|uniref:Uncharacterized protein n=1 Tax=Linnemannia gamsii TaxID=64522 RepID=A0ABQ7JKX3_9FUNG|nr:hypothetical protein BGZ96_002365 [Linnemannia gamsii]
MSQQQDSQVSLFSNNAYGAYNNENGEDDDYNDVGMPSSIVSFSEPNPEDIALQIAILTTHLAMDNGNQDDGGDDNAFDDDHVELFMPDVFESFDEPDLDEVAWQVTLLTLSGNHGHPR